MKTVTFFSLILTFASLSSYATNSDKTIEAELRSALYSQLVGYQPKAVGANDFLRALGADLRNPHWAELSLASKNTENWPTVSFENDVIKITDESSSTSFVIEDLRNNIIKVNGRAFSLDGRKPLLKQIEKFLKNPGERNVRWNFLIPARAEAQDDRFSSKAMVIPIVVGAAYVASQVLVGGVGGAMGLGFIAAGAGAGAVVGGAACTLLQLSRFGETFWERYKNCVAAPLSLVGMNPRDTLRIKNFETCSAEKIIVQVESENGRHQRREFNFARGALTEVRLNEPGEVKENFFDVTLKTDSAHVAFASGTASKGTDITAKLQIDQLKASQGLIRDAVYYRQLCANSGQRQRIESKSESSETAEDVSPAEVFKKTVR